AHGSARGRGGGVARDRRGGGVALGGGGGRPAVALVALTVALVAVALVTLVTLGEGGGRGVDLGRHPAERLDDVGRHRDVLEVPLGHEGEGEVLPVGPEPDAAEVVGDDLAGA